MSRAEDFTTLHKKRNAAPKLKKEQQKRPVYYNHDFSKGDLKVVLGQKLVFAEATIADFVISGFFRSHLEMSETQTNNVPMNIVSTCVRFFAFSPHMPNMLSKLIPLKTVFTKGDTGAVMDLKTPKWQKLGKAARITLRLFLQWRQNTSSLMIGCSQILCKIDLSGNQLEFGLKGSKWARQVLPYHPEVQELYLNNNYIDDEGLFLITEALSVRHDGLESTIPVKKLEKLYLNHNDITDQEIPFLLDTILTYTPKMSEIDLSYNKLTKQSCEAICAFLLAIAQKPKRKDKKLRKLYLRHNEFDFESAQKFNAVLEMCDEDWNVRIELGSNPTQKPFSFEAQDKAEWDPRLKLHGT